MNNPTYRLIVDTHDPEVVKQVALAILDRAATLRVSSAAADEEPPCAEEEEPLPPLVFDPSLVKGVTSVIDIVPGGSVTASNRDLLFPRRTGAEEKAYDYTRDPDFIPPY